MVVAGVRRTFARGCRRGVNWVRTNKYKHLSPAKVVLVISRWRWWHVVVGIIATLSFLSLLALALGLGGWWWSRGLVVAVVATLSFFPIINNSMNMSLPSCQWHGESTTSQVFRSIR